jgi:hypothetical protein
VYIFLSFLAFSATFAGSSQTGLKVDLPGQKGFVKILYLPVANLVVQLSLVAAAFDDPVFFSTSLAPTSVAAPPETLKRAVNVSQWIFSLEQHADK